MPDPARFFMYGSKRRIKAEYELAQLEYRLQRTLIDSGEEYNVFGSSRGEALKLICRDITWSDPARRCQRNKLTLNPTLASFDISCDAVQMTTKFYD